MGFHDLHLSNRRHGNPAFNVGIGSSGRNVEKRDPGSGNEDIFFSFIHLKCSNQVTSLWILHDNVSTFDLVILHGWLRHEVLKEISSCYSIGRTLSFFHNCDTSSSPLKFTPKRLNHNNVTRCEVLIYSKSYRSLHHRVTSCVGLAQPLAFFISAAQTEPEMLALLPFRTCNEACCETLETQTWTATLLPLKYL